MVRYFVFLVLVTNAGCFGFNFSEKDLVGSWQAVQMVEGKDTFQFDLSNVQLHFLQNQEYSYRGNLNNKEAGTYHMIGKMLYTKDTLNQVPEKAVEIIELSSDSLILKMNANGKLRNLEMVRVLSKSS